MNRRKITAVAVIPITLITFLLAGGTADATTVRPDLAVVADDDCGQTATLTIYNQAWWFGLSEDAEVVASNEPTIVPVGTLISIESPFVATFAVTHDLVIDLVVRFPHEPEKLTHYLIPVDFTENCVPVTTTTSAPAPPTSEAPPPPVASGTPAVETAPAFTG